MENVPKHIGIIMDGNGRWAKKKGEIRVFGHKKGMKTLKDIVIACRKLGVEYLTVYAFSTENWKRPKKEVSFLLSLLDSYIKSEVEELKENNVALRFLGRKENLGKKILNEMKKAEEYTKENSKMLFSIAFNYGGRQEITDGIKLILDKFQKGEIGIEDIDENTLSEYLYTKDIPDPDLIIRTSGEFRTSNFLIWQSAYSEYYITDILWPDFNKDELIKGINSYNSRNRRYGGI